LPLLLSLAQIALVARFAGKTYGPFAAALAVLLFALAPSDIFQSEDIRGYVLCKLAVAVSFIGLVAALDAKQRSARGWAAYVGGAVVAIYSHTTMLLWPLIATAAVMAEAGLRRGIDRVQLLRLIVADLAVAVLSLWVVWLALDQLRNHAADISWIEPLSLADYGSSLNLQLLMGGGLISALMAGLIAAGLLRTIRNRVTRLALFVTVASIVAFKAADWVHPIVSDYTLHWCATFTVLLAAAALAEGKPTAQSAWLWARRIAIPVVLVAVFADGLDELLETTYIPVPQDFHYTVETVAHTPRGALLASHESMGVVITQACRLEFHAPRCPFPLVVMQNPARSDGWASGGYGEPLVAAPEVRAALGPARTVYAFSRYLYTPLSQLSLDAGRYRQAQWDDGELIGPIPVRDFDHRRART
jgi:hypothetical protein